jgi:uncharacterized DUF497 family protein
MSDVIIIWDLPEDPDGNVQHIAAHDITIDEVEEVLLDRESEDTISRSSGQPITFGYTSGGRHLAVVWEHVDDNPLTIYPITAYDVPEREGRV